MKKYYIDFLNFIKNIEKSQDLTVKLTIFFSNTDAFRDELGVMKRNYDANFDEKFSFEEFSQALKQNKHLKEFIFDIKYN